MSTEELTAYPPTVLFLPLNEAEIAATVESLHRHQLVEALEGNDAGTQSSSRLWAPTDQGRRVVRGIDSRVGDSLRRIGPVVKTVLTLAIALAGLLGLNALLEKEIKDVQFDWATIGAIAGIVLVYTAFFGFFGTWAWRGFRNDRAKRSVSQDWNRWRRARPEWLPIADRKAPLGWIGVVILCLACLIAVQWQHDFLPDLTGWSGHIPVIDWILKQFFESEPSRRGPNTLVILACWAVGLIAFFKKGVGAWVVRWSDIARLAKAESTPPTTRAVKGA
jgi:hypothetical protein